MRDYYNDMPPDDGRMPGQRQGLWRVLGWLSIAFTAILVAGSLTAYGAYLNLVGNINQEAIGDLGKRPPKVGKALNILLIGSDQRNGANGKYGKVAGERSDTIILAHVSPKRDGATMISFPRDSMVQLPSCKSRTGQVMPARQGMINESFNSGGPTCTWRTIESLTGIHIDHFAKVDFSGFKTVVDALGGVEVCLPSPVNDPKSKLNLPEGRQTVKGEEALAYVRLRYNIGNDGSDLGRIKRQQLFMASLVKKATSSDILTDPVQLNGFLSAAAKTVTTDSNFNIDKMRELAGSAKGLATGKVRFVTVPTRPWTLDPNRVEWVQPTADQLFTSIKNDTQAQPEPKKTAKPKLPPNQVRVQVLNGTPTAGLAGGVADDLEARGFQVVRVGNAPGGPYSKTQLRYGPNGANGVDTVAAALQTPAAKQAVPNARTPSIYLVVGTDWKGVKPPSSSALNKELGGVTAKTNICATPQ